MRPAFSSRTNNRAERVGPDVALVLVAWSTAMRCPSVLQLHLECTSPACAAEMFVNQSDGWKRRRPLHEGGGRYLGGFAALNFSLGTGASVLTALCGGIASAVTRPESFLILKIRWTCAHKLAERAGEMARILKTDIESHLQDATRTIPEFLLGAFYSL